MNLVQFITQNITGIENPIIQALVIGILLEVMMVFYYTLFYSLTQFFHR